MTSLRGRRVDGRGPTARPRIALLLDTPDWAFANIAAQLERHLSDEFDFVSLPVSSFGSLPRALQLSDGARLIHFFWREHITQLDWPDVRRELELLYGSAQLGLARLLGGARLTTCIFDHMYQLPAELADRGDRFRRLGVRYGTASLRLNAQYGSFDEMPPPSAVLRDGVDRSRFVPREPARFAGAGRSRDLVVGWTGNSGFQGLGEDAKGLNTIIRPAIDSLRSRGRRVRLESVDRAVEHRPHDSMPAFYDRIDVYCCASVAEGTPNPVLEAMASGLAVVSTDVGIVPEAFGTLQRPFVLRERSRRALESALEVLLDAPSMLAQLGRENLASVAAWDWSVRTSSYADFFREQLKR